MLSTGAVVMFLTLKTPNILALLLSVTVVASITD